MTKKSKHKNLVRLTTRRRNFEVVKTNICRKSLQNIETYMISNYILEKICLRMNYILRKNLPVFFTDYFFKGINLEKIEKNLLFPIQTKLNTLGNFN